MVTIFEKTKSLGGKEVLSQVLSDAALKAMVFTPETFDAREFEEMHLGMINPAPASGGFCIEEGKNIQEILKTLGKTSRIQDMNLTKVSSRNRVFTLYMQQFMASGDKIALDILDIFEVSP